MSRERDYWGDQPAQSANDIDDSFHELDKNVFCEIRRGKPIPITRDCLEDYELTEEDLILLKIWASSWRNDIGEE